VKISLYEIFCGMMLFQQGTTVIFGFSSGAGRDAWLAAACATLLGTCLVLLYARIYLLMPGLTLTAWYPALFGQAIGVPLAWLYPLLFIYNAGRIVADLKFTIKMVLLPETPEWAILGGFMLVVAYALYSGVQVVFRIAGILLPILTIVYVSQCVLLLASNTMHMEYLLPIAGEGWGRIWQNTWPRSVLQTFGETILFAMFWPLAAKLKPLPKVTALAALCSGILLTLLNVFIIMGLGEGVFIRNIYPTLTLLRLLSVGQFIENLDAFVLLYFIITTFFKLTLYLSGAVLAIRELAVIPQHRRFFIVPLCALVLFIGSTMSSNIVEHLEVAFHNLHIYLWLPLFLYLPLLALPAAWMKRARQRGQSS